MLNETIAMWADLLKRSLKSWDTEADLRVIKSLTGGRSGAEVLKVDISSDKIEPGQYILKLFRAQTWGEEPDEASRHLIASQANSGFAAAHIPSLVRQFSERLVENSCEFRQGALLYEIASSSLERITALDTIAAGPRQGICAALAWSILESWATPNPAGGIDAQGLLSSWLGYRLDRAKNPQFFQFVDRVIGATPQYIAGHHTLVNPIWFFEQALSEKQQSDVLIQGVLHGDLHQGNVLVRPPIPKSEDFWIVDFALSSNGAVGFDHAYLELSLLLTELQNSQPEVAISVLSAVNAASGSELVQPSHLALVYSLRSIRESMDRWQASRHPRRKDPVQRQFLLARVAAGLNWSNKSIDESGRILALYYAGYYAKAFLELYETSAWTNLATVIRPASSSRSSNDVESSEGTLEASYQEIWNQVGKFDSRSGYYVVVSDENVGRSVSPALGQLPFSVVVDLDSLSSTEGLLSGIGDQIRLHRSLHITEEDVDVLNFRTATCWLLANGWEKHGQTRPDINEWRRYFLPRVRHLSKQFWKSVAPTRVYVLVMANRADAVPALDGRLERTVEAIDEAFGGEAKIIVIGDNNPVRSVPVIFIPCDIGEWTTQLEVIYGTTISPAIPTIPGHDETQVPIPIEDLRLMEENLEVLHSRVLEQTALDAQNSTRSFLTGSEPTWSDLNANLDVIRESIYPDLIKTLEQRLEANKNYTVELLHTPGSGGTTVGMRAAWDLMQSHPVAVLRRWDRKAVEQIERLFHIARRPVLIVAEASIIVDSAREQLYRELQARNCRAVLLCIRRTLGAAGNRELFLRDPMEQEEAEKFCKLYQTYTTDQRRKSELARVTSRDDLVRYRSPFFYGLIAFEREYQSIEAFRGQKHCRFQNSLERAR